MRFIGDSSTAPSSAGSAAGGGSTGLRAVVPLATSRDVDGSRSSYIRLLMRGRADCVVGGAETSGLETGAVGTGAVGTGAVGTGAVGTGSVTIGGAAAEPGVLGAAAIAAGAWLKCAAAIFEKSPSDSNTS